MAAFQPMIPTAHRMAAGELTARLASQAAMENARESAEGLLQSTRQTVADQLETARLEAEAMWITAQRQTEDIRATILQRAKADARAIRLTEAAEAATRLTERFDALTPWLGSLVLDCVAQLVGDLDPDQRQRALLAKALSGARRDWTVRLRCHPDESASLRAIVAAESGPKGRFRAVTEVVEDPRLAMGECLLESETGLVEIGISAQIDALRAALDGTVAPPADLVEDAG
jgi:type III secretion protein L